MLSSLTHHLVDFLLQFLKSLLIQKAQKLPDTQVLLLVYVSGAVTVLLPYNSNDHTEYGHNQEELGIVVNLHLIQCQSQLLGLVVATHLD